MPVKQAYNRTPASLVAKCAQNSSTATFGKIVLKEKGCRDVGWVKNCVGWLL
jgi:hypothetical protein